MSVERSLVLCKPDAVLIRQAGIACVQKIMESVKECKLLCFEHHIVTEELATKHYEEHIGKPFFPNLLRFITSKIGVMVMVFEGIDAIKTIRTVLGPTMVPKAVEVECLRGTYGSVAGINCFHASDAPETGIRESNLWADYFKIELNAEKGMKQFEEYKAKYDGKHPVEMTKVREILKEMLKLEDEYLALMGNTTDMDKKMIKELLAIIIQDH